jgi:biotin carboxylase
MSRVLLLVPATTYRTSAFVEASRRLGIDLVVGTEHPHPLQTAQPGSLLTLDFLDHAAAVRRVVDFAARRPIDAVVGIDDSTTILAAALSAVLARRHNAVPAVVAARDKYRMRKLLSGEGVRVPPYALRSFGDDLALEARRTAFPCVVKPLHLSASRGVIRADNEAEFVSAARQLQVLLRAQEVPGSDDERRHFLVERFIPGREVALEGLLTNGELRVLALFDKPDPLDGPFFEETIYVTPSRLPASAQAEIAGCAHRACRALGLSDGPVHAELRMNRSGPTVIEVAARSIGGLCSRTLRFGTGFTLEELILRHALGMQIALDRDPRAAGVMMIPIPRPGILKEVRGVDAAREVPGIEEVVITTHPGQDLVPVPEGASYFGFIFARAEFPARAEAALRTAHSGLEVAIAPPRKRADRGL